MGKYEKILKKVLQGFSDQNIDFNDLRNLLLKFGFKERIKGSHHIFIKDGIEEIMNLQPKLGKAKAYQVKQIRNMVVKNQLKLNEDEK